MKWFRFYHEAYRNPKVQEMRPELFKFWVNTLCVANESTPRGTIPSEAHLRLALGLSKPLTKRWVSELEALALLCRSEHGALTPHDWDKLQPSSDDAAKRKRDERARGYGNQPEEMSRDTSRDKNVTVTPRGREDTDTDTEGDRESVCVTHVREGDDLKDWQEALAELQGSPDAKLIAGMLQESAGVPSVAQLEAWRFIHAAHVMHGQPGKTTWNFFMAVARRADRREFDSWRDPAPRNGSRANGHPKTQRDIDREKVMQWATQE